MQKLKVAALASKGIKGLVDIHLGIPVLKEEAKMAEAVAKDL